MIHNVYLELLNITLQLLNFNRVVFSFVPHSRILVVSDSSAKAPDKSVADPCKRSDTIFFCRLFTRRVAVIYK